MSERVRYRFKYAVPFVNLERLNRIKLCVFLYTTINTFKSIQMSVIELLGMKGGLEVFSVKWATQNENRLKHVTADMYCCVACLKRCVVTILIDSSFGLYIHNLPFILINSISVIVPLITNKTTYMTSVWNIEANMSCSMKCTTDCRLNFSDLREMILFNLKYFYFNRI